MHYLNHQTGSSISKRHPFVCQKKPFVYFHKPLINPFVCLKIPFVRNYGLTLVELIIVLTVAGILAALAVPGLQQFVSSNRLTSQVNDLMADINLARSEAIKQNTTAGVCVTAVGGTTCAASGNWANGWMVYAVVGGVDTPVKTHESLTGNNTLAGPADRVVYDRRGILSNGDGNFTLCDPSRGKSRVVEVGFTGRPALSEGTC